MASQYLKLKVLDHEAAQNLSVILGGTLKYLPTPDQLNKLQEYGKEYEDLAEADQFAISLADIKRLVPRLKSLKFQLHYPELLQDCEPYIVSATEAEACQEVRGVFDTQLRI